MPSMPAQDTEEEFRIVDTTKVRLGNREISVSADQDGISLGYSPIDEIAPWIISDGPTTEGRALAIAILQMCDAADAAVAS